MSFTSLQLQFNFKVVMYIYILAVQYTTGIQSVVYVYVISLGGFMFMYIKDAHLL